MADGAHDHPEILAAIAALEARVDALHAVPPVIPPPIVPPIVEPPEPPEPMPPPIDGVQYATVTTGMVPTEKRDRRFRFDDIPGTRLSGSIAPSFKITDWRWGNITGDQAGNNWQYLVNGVSVGQSIDTTNSPDGSYMISLQLIVDVPDVAPTAQVFIINNGTSPVQSMRQPVSGQNRDHSLASITVDVKDRLAVPLRYSFNQMRKPATDEERETLSERKWTSEGLIGNHPTGYDQAQPMLFKNAEGDYFVGQYYPRNNNDPVFALPYVSRCPAFDGPRGTCDLTPYTTINHGHHPLASGHAGFIAVTLDGRVCDIDITGEVTTWFGPRSVAGVVQTDPQVVMSARIGEKEFVGDPSGGDLENAFDIWPDPQDLDLYYVADFGNNRIATLSRSQQKIIASYDLEGVSSVWVCHDMRVAGVRVCAASPLGVHMFFMDNRPPTFNEIPNAFWIRGKQSDSNLLNSRTYIMTKTGGFWEINPNTGEVRRVVRDLTGLQPFVFFDSDVNGNIGPKNRIYFSWVNSPNSNTGIGIVDPVNDGEWAEPVLGLPHNSSAQLSRPHDFYGHYLWGISIHHHLPGLFLSFGTAESGPVLHRAYLDDDPPTNRPDYEPMKNYTWEHPSYKPGKVLWDDGRLNEIAPLSYAFGHGGNGALGYCVDLFSYRTLDEAKEIIESFVHPDYTDQEWTDVTWYAWYLGARNHFP